jgi:hypothetical protein
MAAAALVPSYIGRVHAQAAVFAAHEDECAGVLRGVSRMRLYTDISLGAQALDGDARVRLFWRMTASYGYSMSVVQMVVLKNLLLMHLPHLYGAEYDRDQGSILARWHYVEETDCFLLCTSLWFGLLARVRQTSAYGDCAMAAVVAVAAMRSRTSASTVLRM